MSLWDRLQSQLQGSSSILMNTLTFVGVRCFAFVLSLFHPLCQSMLFIRHSYSMGIDIRLWEETEAPMTVDAHPARDNKKKKKIHKSEWISCDWVACLKVSHEKRDRESGWNWKSRLECFCLVSPSLLVELIQWLVKVHHKRGEENVAHVALFMCE